MALEETILKGTADSSNIATLKMNRGLTVLTQDPRPIEAVHFSEGGSFVVGTKVYHGAVGEYRITEIFGYDENGEMAAVPWVAVCAGGTVIARIPARMVSIAYAGIAEAADAKAG